MTSSSNKTFSRHQSIKKRVYINKFDILNQTLVYVAPPSVITRNCRNDSNIQGTVINSITAIIRSINKSEHQKSPLFSLFLDSFQGLFVLFSSFSFTADLVVLTLTRSICCDHFKTFSDVKKQSKSEKLKDMQEK